MFFIALEGAVSCLLEMYTQGFVSKIYCELFLIIIIFRDAFPSKLIGKSIHFPFTGKYP